MLAELGYLERLIDELVLLDCVLALPLSARCDQSGESLSICLL